MNQTANIPAFILPLRKSLSGMHSCVYHIKHLFINYTLYNIVADNSFNLFKLQCQVV